MKLPTVSQSTPEFTVPDPGVYTLEFMGFDEPVPNQFEEGKLRIKMGFQIVEDDEYDGTKVFQWYGYSMHPQAHLYAVVKALSGGQEIEAEEEIDLEDLIGKKVQGTLDTITKPRRDNPAETVSFPKIIAVSPLRRKKTVSGTGASLDEAKADQRTKQKEADAEIWDEDVA